MPLAVSNVSPDSSLYERTLAERRGNYQEALLDGIYRPIVYPRDATGALFLFLGILVLPRLSKTIAKYLRLPIVSLVIAHCFYVVRSCRNIGMAGGYGVGLSCAWGCIMTVNLLLIDDIRDFQRLETRASKIQPDRFKESNGHLVSTSNGLASGVEAPKPVKQRSNQTEFNQHSYKASSTETSYQLTWQKHPSSLVHAIEWSLDLLTAFRGVNWNFRIPTLKPVQLDNASPRSTTLQSSKQSTMSLNELQRKAVMSFIFHYLLLDFLKSTWVQDPYFMGIAPMSSPHPLVVLRDHPLLTRWARLLLSVISVYTALMFVFNLCPLFFTTILPSLVGHRRLLKYTRTPFLEPDMYPAYWYSPTNILDKGVASLWGKVWHQMFRFGISEPGRFLVERLQLNPRSNAARAIQLFVAFGLTGFIHAMASYTSFPPAGITTRPVSGPFVFFITQAIGILLQQFLSTAIGTKHFPSVVRKAGNLGFVFMWAFWTGPLLANDFAKCGVWLFEPIPISFFRGIRGEGWWHWGTLGDWVGIWTGNSWWEYGLAIY